MSLGTFAGSQSYLPQTPLAPLLPCRQGYPLVGVLPALRRDPLTFFVETVREWGDLVELPLGSERILMVNRPSYIRHVLQDNRLNYHKSKFVQLLSPILGDGMFLAEGEVWKCQRQNSAPAFQGCQLTAMTQSMRDAITDLIYRWRQKELRAEPVAIVPEMMHLSLDMVLRSLFNVRLTTEFTQVYDSLTAILRDTEERFWSYVSLPRWLPTPHNQRFRHALQTLDDFVYGIIDERRRHPRDEPDLLSLLIEAADRQPTSRAGDKLLRDQVLSIILAGHDTTANALSWSWITLSRHPDVARRIKQEVDQVLGRRMLTVGDVPALRYTKMAFDEVLRLFPPLWTYSRTAQADDRLGPYRIPKGTNVMLCAYAVHRNPALWPNPEGFDPERFDPDREPQHDRFAYIPFGGGPRRCLGARFAVLEGTIALAMISQVFRLELLPGQRVAAEPMITLRPDESVRLQLCPG
jgi:cytochrome P450